MENSNRLAQFGTILAAYGLEMTYNSQEATLEVKDIPKDHSDIINGMMDEISHFDDASNYVDGVASFCVARYLDDEPNPIEEQKRMDVLHALGIMKDGRYIHQVLMRDKNNKSWHQSGIANDCEFFGVSCTHRGINPDPNRKGRTSSRQPEEYHILNGKGMINREQLVTPNLELLFRLIPEDNLISAQPIAKLSVFDLVEFKKLSIEEKVRLVATLQEAI